MRPQRLAEGRKRAQRILRIWGYGSLGKLWREHPDWRDYTYHRMVRTRVPCSCSMCGNPRRHYGERTRQEQIADLEMQEQIAEYMQWGLQGKGTAL